MITSNVRCIFFIFLFPIQMSMYRARCHIDNNIHYQIRRSADCQVLCLTVHGNCGKFLNEALHNLSSSTNIVTISKLRRCSSRLSIKYGTDEKSSSSMAGHGLLNISLPDIPYPLSICLCPAATSTELTA
jgi:hypothetical protein